MKESGIESEGANDLRMYFNNVFHHIIELTANKRQNFLARSFWIEINCKQVWNRVKVSIHITDGMSRQIFVLRQRRSFFLGYSMPGTTQYGK